jgi:hypothetical protein
MEERHYRVFFLCGGRIVEATLVLCADDSEALEKAKAFGRELELWQRERLIARIAADGGIISPTNHLWCNR